MNKHLPFLYLRPILITIVLPWLIIWFSHAKLADELLFIVGIILAIIGYITVAFTQWQLYKPAQWTSHQSSFEVPDKLVTTGLYGYIRNPQLWGIYVTVLGTGLMSSSWWVALYLTIVLIPSATVAVRVEEPQLATKFGGQYIAYKKTVFRFLPGLF